jgi:hypothetical protein
MLVKRQDTGEIVMLGKREGNLYVLEHNMEMPILQLLEKSQ